MENMDIKEKIKEVIKRCQNPDIYANILNDFFKDGIALPSKNLNMLNILPELSSKELEKNIKKNISTISSYIKNEIKSIKEAYQVLSCIYGCFLGDAMGAFCEFQQASKNNYKSIFNSEVTVIGGLCGQVTDDSEMAMSFAYAIMDSTEKENLDVNYLYFYYGAWYKTGPLDIGATTERSLKPFNFYDFLPEKKNFNKIQDTIFTNNFNSLSNGFLMRKSTFIAWLYYRFYSDINVAFNPIDDNKYLLPLYQKIKELSHIDNQCTNPNFETDAVSGFYCLMALGAIKGLKACNIIEKISFLCKDNYFKNGHDEDRKIANYILYCIQMFKDLNFNFSNFFINQKSGHCINNNIGYYGHAFELTLYYLINFELINEKDKFKGIMNDICNLGGDTDTNACIVGGVIGPLIGFSEFSDFDKIINIIPPHRGEYSIALMYLYVRYLKLSNRKDELIKNNRYFLKIILDLLYGEVEIDYISN